MPGLLLALVVSFLVAGVVVAASAELTRPLWRSTPWLAPSFGLLGLGLVAHLAWMLTWADRWAVVAFAGVVVAGAVAVLVRTRAWRLLGVAAPLTLLTGSLMLLAVGHTFLFGGATEPFLTAQYRYVGLMVDNELPYLFGHHLWNDLSTHGFVGDWNGSDRPPLQSGLLLLLRPVAMLFGVPADAAVESVPAQQWGMAAGVVAQYCWAPAAYSLLRAVGFSARPALVATAFLQTTPLMVWNSTFTWPKLMAAAYGVAGLAVLVTALRDRTRSPVLPVTAASMLAMLGYLAHGSTAFAGPMLVGLGGAVLWRSGAAIWLRVGVGSAAVAAGLYAPWSAYATWADPSHARLLKWYFAGETVAGTTPFVEVLRQAYATTPLSEHLGNRAESLARAFDPQLDAHLDLGSRWAESSRASDFFSPWWALGISTLLVLAAWSVWALHSARARRWHREPSLAVSGGLILSGVVSMVVWALAVFSPELIAAALGSYVWLLVFAAIPLAWLAARSVRAVALLAGVQLAYDQMAYAFPAVGEGGRLSAWAVATMVVGAVILTAAIAAAWRAGPRRTPAGWRRGPAAAGARTTR